MAKLCLWSSESLSFLFSNLSQVSLEVNSQERTLELRAQGQDGDFVSCIFPVPQLFDLRWHKLMLSVASRVASVHVDCVSASSQPLGPRQPIQPGGHVFLGLDAEQGKPVSVSTGS